MSRVYFHSPSGEAELHGSERAYLDSIAKLTATNAYRIDKFTDEYELKKAAWLLEMIPEDHRIHDQYHEALDAFEKWKAANANRELGPIWATYVDLDHRPSERLALSLKNVLDGFFQNDVGRVEGISIDFSCVALNTALVAGSDEIALAAKIEGWCESHLWVDGPDRAWLADLMQSGLDKGIYRKGLNDSSQGWESVIELLQSNDDEPVVTSFSITDQFPNRETAKWAPKETPDWKPAWANTPEGLIEWEQVPEDDKEGYRQESVGEQWYELDYSERWRLSMEGIKRDSPWLQLTPESLRGTTFLIGVTAYDLISPDRVERVKIAADKEDEVDS